MNLNLIPGERLTPCPQCAEPTIVRDRVYTFDGYPYVHECPPAPRKVPNEKDFCICGTLTWSGLCDDCKGRPVSQVVQQANQRDTGRIRAVRANRGGIDL